MATKSTKTAPAPAEAPVEEVKSEVVEEIKGDPGEEYVDFMIPRGGLDQKAQLIGVNGEFIRVMPGVTVTVKRKFVEAWENSLRAQDESWQTQLKAQAASKKALADM